MLHSSARPNWGHPCSKVLEVVCNGFSPCVGRLRFVTLPCLTLRCVAPTHATTAAYDRGRWCWGVPCSGVRNESDPALALLADHVESSSHAMRCGTCVGLGVAYAGARREDVVELLTPLVANSDNANMVEVQRFVTHPRASLIGILDTFRIGRKACFSNHVGFMDSFIGWLVGSSTRSSHRSSSNRLGCLESR